MYYSTTRYSTLFLFIKVRPAAAGRASIGEGGGGAAAGERWGGELGTVGCGRRSEGRCREARLAVCVRARERRGRRSRWCGSAEEGGGRESDG